MGSVRMRVGGSEVSSHTKGAVLNYGTHRAMISGIAFTGAVDVKMHRPSVLAKTYTQVTFV